MVRLFTAILISLLLCNNSFALNQHVEINAEPGKDKQYKFIPYAFYNKATGAAVATVFLAKGYLQPQASTVANVFVGSTGSFNGFLATSNLLTPLSDRLFVDSLLMYSDWDEVDSYQDGNPNYILSRAGSNDSNKNDFITATGDDFFAHVTFKFLLPIGHGRNDPIHTFALDNGILTNSSEAGGERWNPIKTGRTTIELRPFFRNQSFEDTKSPRVFENKTSGVKLSLEYDNTDWFNNPTRGSAQRLTFSRDWGLNSESSTWSSVQFSHSQYWDLGATDRARQRVLAFNFWTSDAPTWDSSHTGDLGFPVFHRPPLFEGSTLGGLERQRGYAATRFHDRSAINYTLEYRYMPQRNVMSEIPYVKKLHIPWWQITGFVEVGRVAPEYDLKELHKDMKTTIGGSVRALIYGLVIRLDMGFTEEGTEVQMFFNHPF